MKQLLCFFVAFFSVVHVRAASAQKDWTMLVFLNGNNNLDPYGAFNINQMEKHGSDEHRNIVVQWGSLAAKTTKRLFVEKDNDPSQVTSPIVQELPDVDMGNKQSLMDFIEWAARYYPAKKYFVVVWNHGGGWHFTGQGSDVLHPTDISWDEKTGHRISTEELAQVMHGAAKVFGHKVDLYASDACLMSMIEVAYQMQGAVETFAGSEETEPGAGWPYDSFLQAWSEKPLASSLQVGKMLADSYAKYYEGSSGQSTFSVTDMSKLPALVASMKTLSSRLRAMKDKQILLKKTASAVRFFSLDYVDIGSVVDGIKSLTNDPTILKSIAQVEAQLQKTVYYNRTNTKAKGMSVWWPLAKSDWTTYQKRYEALSFSRATGWHSFLRLFY